MSVQRRAEKLQRGLSLVELMIALSLSAILSLAMFEVFQVSRNSFNQVHDANEMLDSAQLSFSLLQDSINMAGFWGGVDSRNLDLLSNQLTMFPGSCDAAWVLNVSLGLQGFDGREGANSIPSLPEDCLSEDYVPHSDVIIVRRASALDVIAEEKLDNKYYKNRYIVRGFAGGNAVIFLGKDALHAQDRISKTTLVENRLLSIDMYYLEYCRDLEVCDDSGISLNRYTLSGSRFIKQSLVNGVAQVQYEYGVDTGGDRKVDGYVSADEVEDWSDVLSVRVFMLLKGKNRHGADQNISEEFKLGDTFEFNIEEQDARYRYKKFQSEFSLKNV